MNQTNVAKVQTIRELVMECIEESDNYEYTTRYISWNHCREIGKAFALEVERDFSVETFISLLEQTNQEETMETLRGCLQYIVEAVAEYHQEEEEYNNMTDSERVKEKERRSVDGRDSENTMASAIDYWQDVIEVAAKQKWS